MCGHLLTLFNNSLTMTKEAKLPARYLVAKYRTTMNFLRVACSCLLLLSSAAVVSGFCLQDQAAVNRYGVHQAQWTSKPRPFLFSSPIDEDTTDSSIEKLPVPSVTPSEAKVSEPESAPYPIDLPSPILLATSMILAIVGTGSAFDLGGASPSLGFGTTAAIAGVTIPLCLFLFYASILKATAETEADDKEYMKGKKF